MSTCLLEETAIQLINGDCIEKMKKVPTGSVDLIITDPPYNLANFMRDRQANLKRMRSNFFGDAGWDDLEFEDWVASMNLFFQECSRILKTKGSMIMFMSLMRIETIISLATKYKFYYKTTGIWHKRNPMPRNMNLHFINSTEGWLYFINDSKTGTFNNSNKAIHDFIETSIAPAGEKRFGGHPTQKPETLFEHFIELLTNEGNTVMDPFMGSGTAAVAAKKTGRKFIGIELNKDYFEVAKKRVETSKYKLVSSFITNSINEV